MDNCIAQHNLHLQYFQTMTFSLFCVHIQTKLKKQNKKKTFKKCWVDGLLYKTIVMLFLFILVLLV